MVGHGGAVAGGAPASTDDQGHALGRGTGGVAPQGDQYGLPRPSPGAGSQDLGSRRSHVRSASHGGIMIHRDCPSIDHGKKFSDVSFFFRLYFDGKLP